VLTSLSIRDYAVVDRLELDLYKGLTVLSGETGAGKSILVGALGLLLGERADSSIVRHGTKRTEISATINISDNSVATHWLSNNELDDEGECLLRRTISAEGRSRAWVNGRVVNLQQLRNLGELLIDIHGQHEHQSLLKKDQQRQLLDHSLNDLSLLASVSEHFHIWQRLKDEYQALHLAASDRHLRLELLRFQVEELDALNFSAIDIKKLEQEHLRLANAEKLITCSQNSLADLDENSPSVMSLLNSSQHDLQQLQNNDPQLTPIIQLMDEASIQLQEAISELRHYQDNLEIDPSRMQQVEQRLSLLHDIARKHRIKIEEVPDLTSTLHSELDTLVHAGERLDTLQADIDKAAENFQTKAKQLSKKRSSAATKLGKQVSSIMNKLGMPGGRLDIQISPLEKFSALGLDQIDFMVATNPEQPLKALHKIVSGGELSRISLALQVIMANDHGIPTLIFDEVDVGIGGGVAEIVGQKLRALADKRQILCITHLPQVAAQGHHHLKVSKQQTEKTTSTRIENLELKSRYEEIARMLGGVEITAQTRAHAKEMIELSNV